MKGEEVGIPDPDSRLESQGGVLPSCVPPGCLSNFDEECHPETFQEEPRPEVGPRHSQEL